VTWDQFPEDINYNVYETLLWYNGTNSTGVIPWLAQNYSMSADGKTANFTLRSGITFADGQPFNSTAVYFSLNRLLIEDNSKPYSHGSQASWIIQQLLNTSLSWNFGGPHNYTQQWASEVLAQNFVQITGPLTFTLHIQNPNAAFPFLISNSWASIVEPQFVMQHDVALWNQSSTGYVLPFPSLTGNLTSQMRQYYMDMVSTCDTGATPKGCGVTYLDGSLQGSTAGTGPYTMQSYDPSTNDIVLVSNPNYWGGPLQFMGGSKITPTFTTVDINYVPQVTTRELDLENAAKSGQAMTIDVTNDHLYDVADRNSWLNNGVLNSTIQGVNVLGPFTTYDSYWDVFATNVSNPFSGQFYQFQPFADLRIRLAFADSVNMSAINDFENNNLGQVANSLIPPGFPPGGSYNSSLTPRYGYNLTAVQDLLLAAMQRPITTFNFENGTAAPSGLFNNTFGCPTLNSQGTCDNPVAQTFTLTYRTGDTVNEGILSQIASVINNVSSTYNMGLTITLTPIPLGQLFTYALSGQLYCWGYAYFPDYPWSFDLLPETYAPGNLVPEPSGWNLTVFGNLYQQAIEANMNGNVSGMVAITNQMDYVGNQAVMYLWTFFPEFFQPTTANVHGYYFNPSLFGDVQYFASLS
jgi:ABC-type transport system substrate-binding protein